MELAATSRTAQGRIAAVLTEGLRIEHRLTKPNYPWTNGQAEQMNRTIKDATVKRYHYDSHDQLPVGTIFTERLANRRPKCILCCRP